MRVRSQGSWRIGWIVDTWAPGLLTQIERLAPDYVFINYKRFPDSMNCLPERSWQWALFEISDPHIALGWLARGANLIETNEIGEMRQHLLVHHKD